MRIINYFDFYGSTYNFYIFNQQKFKTLIGTILTLMTLSLTIVITIFFGEDFLLRKNPKMLYSKHSPAQYQYYNITGKELYFGWRINFNNGTEANISNIIYPKAYYQQYYKDPETFEYSYDVKELKIERCQKAVNVKNWNFEEFYCFNLDNLILGGDWDADEFYFISLYLHFCEDGNPYSNETCSESLDKLNEISISDDPYYLTMIYPEHFFQPQNSKQEEALKIEYRGNSFALSTELEREDYFIFQKTELIDDVGLIINSLKKKTAFSLQKHTTDYFYYSLELLKTEGSASLFYNFNIMLSKDYDEYNRIYMKFQDVLAKIGGFVRVIVIFGEIISSWTNNFFLDASLINYLFKFNNNEYKSASLQQKKEKVYQQNINAEILGNNSINKQHSNKSQINQEQEHNKNNNDSSLNNLNQLVSKINVNNNSSTNQNSSLLVKKGNSFNNNNNPSSSILLQNSLPRNTSKISKANYSQIIKKKRKEKEKFFYQYNIPFCKLIKYILLPCLSDYKTNQEYKQLLTAKKAILKRKDIINYFDFMNEFQIIKRILFPQTEITALEHKGKINLQNKEQLAIIYGNDFLTEEEEIKKIKEMVHLFTSNESDKHNQYINGLDSNNNYVQSKKHLCQEINYRKDIYLSEFLDPQIKNIL